MLRKVNGNKEYYSFNVHGDTVKLTNSTGSVLKDYFYDAFGNQKTENENDTNPFRYCGEYYDSETGLIYLRARYYDPSTGRFISEDPIKDGLNWYVYCGDEPINRIDPLGTNWFLNWLMDMFKSQYELEMAKYEAVDDAQKNIQRDIWKLGAQSFLREQKGYLTSAWMLEHACQDNPTDQYRGNDSHIASLIKSDKAFKNDLKAVMKKYENSDSFLTERRGITFSEGDLYYSIHGCGITYSGIKQKDGSWIISCKMDDTYDYTEMTSMMGTGLNMGTTLGTLANDAAVISQDLGALNEYKIVVEFQVRYEK